MTIIATSRSTLDIPTDAPIVVCFGGGVDSTAMLVALHQHGIRPDLITFADVGGEKPETYTHVRAMDTWLKSVGFPTVTWCKKLTKQDTPYDDLEGNNTANETLPSLAFGMKSCSIKWKQGPQDQMLKGCKSGVNKRAPHPLWIQAQRDGVKIVKLIGYDAGTADIRRSKSLKGEDKDFRYVYPLQQLGFTRGDCVKTIKDAGLPVPIKSACWFCPASKKWELYWLAAKHPELFIRALEMEHTAMLGKHSRWGEYLNKKGELEVDAATYGKDWEEFVAKPADQWPTTKITVGLGRGFSWNHWALQEGIVNAERNEVIMDTRELLIRARDLHGDDNALDAREFEDLTDELEPTEEQIRTKRIVHGTPITPKALLPQLAGGSFCVSFADPRDLDATIELTGSDQILVLDNGAFTHWKAGKGEIDRTAFWAWANQAQDRSEEAVAVIPDVIGGSEQDNLLELSWALREGLADYPERTMGIWHMDDSLEQLKTMCRLLNFVGIGSCAEFDVQKNRAGYLERLREASAVIDYVETFHGRRPWVHLMRGLGVLHEAIRFDSADSTNVARNHNRTRGDLEHVKTMAARIAKVVADAALEAPIGAASETTNFQVA